MPRLAAGHLGADRSIGGGRAGLLRPRPDQGVAVALFVVEEVRVDRSVEARIVELDREVVAVLFRALLPGGAEFDILRCTAKCRLC